MKRAKHNPAFDDILDSLENNKEKIALVNEFNQVISYGDFQKLIVGARLELVKRGVRKGSKVLVFISMSANLYVILEALFSLGAVIVFIDPWMGGLKMNRLINQVKPEYLLMSKKIARFTWLLPATWSLKKWVVKNLPKVESTLEIADINDDDTALITFTSGSTGKPKGAKRTFAFIDAQAKVLKEKLIGDGNQQNVDYTNLPIVGLAGFAVGNTLVIPKINLMKIDKAAPTELAAHLVAEKITRLIVSPALLDKILEGIENKETRIKKAVTGGGPVSPQLVEKCLKQFGHIEFEAIYGSTEAEPIAVAKMSVIWEKMQNPLKGIYVGTPHEKVSMKIMASNDGAVDIQYYMENILKEAEIGEILVSGNHVNKYYYKNQEAFTRNKIVDNEGVVWHRTGDLGYQEGSDLYLVGRENRIINVEGNFYYPYPIEQYVQMVSGYSDVGYIQNSSGEVLLYIGSTEPFDPKELISKVGSAGYPLDNIISTRKKLPRDPRHKSKLLVGKLKH